MLLTRSPLIPTPKSGSPLDLHVLSTPPAFILSQDQTLHQHHTHHTHTHAQHTHAQHAHSTRTMRRHDGSDTTKLQRLTRHSPHLPAETRRQTTRRPPRPPSRSRLVRHPDTAKPSHEPTHTPTRPKGPTGIHARPAMTGLLALAFRTLLSFQGALLIAPDGSRGSRWLVRRSGANLARAFRGRQSD